MQRLRSMYKRLPRGSHQYYKQQGQADAGRLLRRTWRLSADLSDGCDSFCGSVRRRLMMLRQLRRIREEKAAQRAIASQPLPCGCPGTQAKTIRHEQQAVCPTAAEESAAELTSELTQWPRADQAGSGARPYFDGQSFWWLQTVQRMRMRISTKNISAITSR